MHLPTPRRARLHGSIQVISVGCALIMSACGSSSPDGPSPSGGDGKDNNGPGTPSAADASTRVYVEPVAPVTDAGGPETSGGPSTTCSVSGPLPAGAPPFGGSSNGTGGAAPVDQGTVQVGSVTYYLIVPSSYAGAATSLFVMLCGTAGAKFMINTLDGTGPFSSIRVAIDPGYTSTDAAAVIDDLRNKYNIDNDRTVVFSESAGTSAGLDLAFNLRQGWFAGYFADDVVTSGGPSLTAAQLGFCPWGNSGPGGNFADANAIVSAMVTAGYRVSAPAPYNGPGASQHGSAQQGIFGIAFLTGISRR